ncbi:MAG: hypothetical protein DMG57_40390 [Acidobacteria bacterium]|nr:MAG: hypothetical protein DMG57_40390 [Acidobacteriota bacterium]
MLAMIVFYNTVDRPTDCPPCRYNPNLPALFSRNRLPSRNVKQLNGGGENAKTRRHFRKLDIALARFLGPSGKVYAEDISNAELIKLKEHLAKEGLRSVEVIKGAEDDPKLPPDGLNAVSIVNAYYESRA